MLLWHVGLFAGVRYLSLLTATRPFLILYSIMSHCFSRHSSNDGHPSSLSMSVTLNLFLSVNLAALHCTISSFWMLPLVYGSHNVGEYSSDGLTKVW